MALTTAQRRVNEGSSAVYTATIVDEDGTALAASGLTTLTLTLYDNVTQSIINSRTDQDVLNANNVTVSSGGVLVWTMQAADNNIIGRTPIDSYENHRALFEWTWASGARAGSHEVIIEVLNIGKA